LLADIALKDAQFRALGKLPQRNYQSSYNWVWNRKPFGPGRYEYIFHQDDFVSLAGRSENEHQIVNFVESLLDGWFTCLKVCEPDMTASFPPCPPTLNNMSSQMDSASSKVRTSFERPRTLLFTIILREGSRLLPASSVYLSL